MLYFIVLACSCKVYNLQKACSVSYIGWRRLGIMSATTETVLTKRLNTLSIEEDLP